MRETKVYTHHKTLIYRYVWHTRNHISLAVWVTPSGEPFVEFLEKQTSEENEECGINARHPAPIFNILIKKKY